MRVELFALFSILFVIVLLATAAYAQRKRRRLSGQDCDPLIRSLLTVDRYKVAQIASSLTERRGGEGDLELGPEEIWELIGGMDGLECLERNCAVLIELACVVQQNYPEALLVAEHLRLSAREIRWHVARLRDSAKTAENLHQAFPHYAQRAVATYYSMTQQVLALYEVANLPTYAELQQAL